MQKAILLITCLFATLSCRAWYIPCFCGCGLPIEYMVAVQHTAQYALEAEKGAKLAALVSNGMSQLQTTVKTYNNLRETYETIGKIRNFTKNFDFSKIASTWEIDDWDDLKDRANTLKYATKGWSVSDQDQSPQNGRQKTETSFLADILRDSARLSGEIKTDLKELGRALIDINGFNTDSAIRAIIKQEERNAQLKARAAIASQQVKSTADTAAAAGGEISNDSASVADRLESTAISKSVETALWSDMANSFNRATMMRLDSLNGYIESKRAKLIKRQKDYAE